MFEWIRDKLEGIKEKEGDLPTSTPSEDKEKSTRELSQEEGVILGKSLEKALLEQATEPIDDSTIASNDLEVDHENLVVRSEGEESIESLGMEFKEDLELETQENLEEPLNREDEGQETSSGQTPGEKIEELDFQKGDRALENDQEEKQEVEDKSLEALDKDEVLMEKQEEAGGLLQELRSGFPKIRRRMNQKTNQVLGIYVKIDDDLIDDSEDILISPDMGVETTMEVVDRLKVKIIEGEIKDPQAIYPALKEVIQELLDECKLDSDLEADHPTIVLVVKVNGVGKATTISKLSAQLKNQGKNVLIAAADTFRAAAIDQVKNWGTRANAKVVSHLEGADLAAVACDAIQTAKAGNIDVLVVDTARRLHSKSNLMEELEKTSRTIEREYPEANRENLLVLDATTGQDAILQAKTFDEATNLTGFILTKLDGTAKGDAVTGFQRELNVLAKLIGVGEQVNDPRIPDSKKFVEAFSEGGVET